MIKVEYSEIQTKGGTIAKIRLVSNRPDQDQALMDAIGEAIVGNHERRGGYDMSSGDLLIDVKLDDK